MAGGVTLAEPGSAAMLVKRYVQQPLTLSEPRDVLVFLVRRHGVVPGEQQPSATPVCGSCTRSGPSDLALSVHHLVDRRPAGPADRCAGGADLHRPAAQCVGAAACAAWASRSTLVTVLLALGIRQVVRWNADRQQTAFIHDATGASLALAAQMREPLAALEAIHGVFIASEDVTLDEMRLATQAWLAPGGLQGIAWSESVRRDALPAYEARVRTEGGRRSATYAVFDRADGAEVARADEAVVAIRYIEPIGPNSRVRSV